MQIDMEWSLCDVFYFENHISDILKYQAITEKADAVSNP